MDAILDGASLALAEAFPACTVYGDERVRQGLLTPSFFVGLGECSQRPLPCGLVEQQQIVEVVYFPERQGDYGEMWAVGPKALRLLGELRLAEGGAIRGRGQRCEINDGLMHIRAVYTLRLRPVESRERMGNMRFQSGIAAK